MGHTETSAMKYLLYMLKKGEQLLETLRLKCTDSAPRIISTSGSISTADVHAGASTGLKSYQSLISVPYLNSVESINAF